MAPAPMIAIFIRASSTWVRSFLQRAATPRGYSCNGSGLHRHARLSTAEARTLRKRAANGHTNGAILELGNLAERIERRIGQQIRRRLVVAERDEHRTARHAVVGARIQRHGSAPRCDRDDVSGSDA